MNRSPNWVVRVVGVHLVVLVLLAGGVTTQAAADPVVNREPQSGPVIQANTDAGLSGFRSYDVTGDNWPDVVTRNRATGQLDVHVHSGVVNGSSTFLAPTAVGYGWGIHSWIGVGNIVDSVAKDGTEESENEAYLGDLVGRRASDGALLVYPHSGTFNGASTWLPPVVVGYGWQIMQRIWIADADLDGYDDIIGMDNLSAVWVYPNTRFLDGVNTFGARIRVSENLTGPYADIRSYYHFAAWYQDAPDFISAFPGDGGMVHYSPNSRSTLGTTTWPQWRSVPGVRIVSQDAVRYSAIVTLADVTGNGSEDLVTAEYNGDLWLYPVRIPRLGQQAGVESRIYLGGGWDVYDIVT